MTITYDHVCAHGLVITHGFMQCNMTEYIARGIFLWFQIGLKPF
jgi:hypothetical protein